MGVIVLVKDSYLLSMLVIVLVKDSYLLSMLVIVLVKQGPGRLVRCIAQCTKHADS